MMGRRGRRQERKLERLQNRLQTLQTTQPEKVAQIERLQKKIARTEQKIAHRKGLPGLTMPMVPTTLQQQGVTAEQKVVVPPPLPPFPPGSTPPANWNEAAYLARHPDVAQAVKMGAVPSGLWHFIKSGQAEGRALSGLEILKEPSTWMWGGLGVAAIGLVYAYFKN